MKENKLDVLANHYIDAWSTTNGETRKSLISKVYSTEAEFYANEPGDEAIKHVGLDAIFQNISQVNDRLVTTNGLITKLISFSKNHDVLRVSWEMITTDGEIALKGMNLLLLSPTGKINKDYIFIN